MDLIVGVNSGGNALLQLAALAQRVSFSLVPGQPIVADPIHHLTLRPANALNVVVKRRSWYLLIMLVVHSNECDQQVESVEEKAD